MGRHLERLVIQMTSCQQLVFVGLYWLIWLGLADAAGGALAADFSAVINGVGGKLGSLEVAIAILV